MVIRIADAQLLKKDVAHVGVIMLACMDNFIGNMICPAVKGPGNRGYFHKIRPGPGNEHHFYHKFHPTDARTGCRPV